MTFSLKESNINYKLQQNIHNIHNIQKNQNNIVLYLSQKISNLTFLVSIIIILYFIKILNLYDIIKCILGVILVFILKNIFKRQRPYRVNDNVKLLDNYQYDLYSLPSGHTFLATIIAFYIYRNIKYTFVFLLPLIVGFSRIYLGVHYLTDVFMSFILGWIVFL